MNGEPRSGERISHYVESVVPLFIDMDDVLIRSWFRSFKNLSVDGLLGTSFINRCTRDMISTKGQVVPWHSKPVKIITRKIEINCISADITELIESMNSRKYAPSDDFNLFHVARHTTVFTHTPGAVLVSCQSTGLMKIEIHCNVVERQCSITVLGLMDILSGKLFYI